MSDKHFSQEDVLKLKKLFTEGIRVLRETEDLREGLKDTVKSIAEEMDIKPAVLNKAIKVAHKSTLQVEKEGFDELEEILEVAGYTL